MILRPLLAGLATLLLAAGVHASETVTVASTPGATSDAIEALIPEARAQGLEVKLIEFTDWTLPNEAVNNGDVDLNFFQHQAFLDNAIKERGYHLRMVGLGLLQNIGIYSNRIKRLEDVPEGARVSLANDPVNQGRGLLLLQKAGLITLRGGKAEQASQALLYSGIDDTFYAMGFVARTDRADAPKIARFVSLFQSSPKVRAVIAARFGNDPKLYTLPWRK
ncbi:Methionine ABC transporter substrate-binding protein [plant metagenome]|uniref:Methionine ABC transporter substrate-binding protein n=1 Tax=plant metagenome TaxID=1297885 RepID=A0A484URR6_9ZZZZ